MAIEDYDAFISPVEFVNVLWPHIQLYDKQREILMSVRDNIETVVPAGNMLGKDFTSSLCILYFLLTRHPVRQVLTSAKEDHLRVLFGEIKNHIATCKYPLTADKGGPLVVHHREIKKRFDGVICPKSYCVGLVASADKSAAMQGHHIAQENDGVPRTLFVADECSSVPDVYYQMAKTWFHRGLFIGNPWPCENFFKYSVEGVPGTDDIGGDLYSANGKKCYRKVIQIKATDSPNVKLGLAQKAAGIEPTNEILIPGVKPYETYVMDLSRWNEHEKCVGLNAEFYQGSDVRMFPLGWLERAEEIAEELDGVPRTARAIGCDPAEGGDKTCWSVIDELGVIELISMKTPDTTVITARTKALIRKYRVDSSDVVFDAGGGGVQHVDRLRKEGYSGVRAFAFGSAPMDASKYKPFRKSQQHRMEVDETRYTYKRRRDQMFGLLRQMLDPSGAGFGIPAEYSELRRQLAPIPLLYDGEGRLEMPPKRHKGHQEGNSRVVTLTDLIGSSPDEADSLALAIYGMVVKPIRVLAGAI